MTDAPPEVPTPEAIERWGPLWWLEDAIVPEHAEPVWLRTESECIWIHSRRDDRRIKSSDRWRGPLLERPPPRPVEPDNWVERLAKRKGW